MAVNASQSQPMESGQHAQYFLVSWNTGGSLWCVQAEASSFSVMLNFFWHPKRLHVTTLGSEAALGTVALGVLEEGLLMPLVALYKG